MKKIAAIEKWNNFYPGRKDILVELVNFVMNCGQGFVSIGPFAQQDDALHDVIVVHNFSIGSMNRLSNLPQANLGALSDGGDVLDAQDCSVFCGYGGLLDILHAAE